MLLAEITIGISVLKVQLDPKDADGCAEQTCSPFSCCLKTLVFIEASFFYSQKPSPGYDTDDNYVLKSLFDSGRVKGVWHPPKFVRIG